MWSELAEFIKSVGFPIAVALYLLCRIEPVIKDLGKSVVALTIIIASSNGSDYKKAFKLAGIRKCRGGLDLGSEE